jgi:hypothetical protein
MGNNESARSAIVIPMDEAKLKVTKPDDGRPRLVIGQKCKVCEVHQPLRNFPRSAPAKSGRLGMCSKCFGQRISKARKKLYRDRRKVAADVGPAVDSVVIANKALQVMNSPSKSLLPEASSLIRRFILKLSESGVEVCSIKVENGKVRTVYRIEEEVEL